jgi:hypothetical protein
VETATARAIGLELHRYHGEALGEWGAHLNDELERTVELLPEPEGWTVSRAEPVVFAVANGTLFRLALDVEGKRIAVVSRPLRVEKLAVTFAWGAESHDDETREALRETSWTFSDADQGERVAEGPLRIEGAVRIDSRGVERPDDRERFARSLAGDAGWGTVY